jgi:hypothetical protein
VAGSVSPRQPVVVYVHGIDNQPTEAALKRQWDLALFGKEMGARSRVAYWVNRRRYPTPAPADKLLPLPAAWSGWMTDQVTFACLPDAHDFLFHPARCRRMESRLRAALRPTGERFVIVAHSQGSMIAYEVLRKLRWPREAVPLLLTFGSPLGIAEVQHALRDMARVDTLAAPSSVTKWINVADRLDVVAADARLANDFAPQGFVEDFVAAGLNADGPFNPHSATGYLRSPAVRRAVQGALG